MLNGYTVKVFQPRKLKYTYNLASESADMLRSRWRHFFPDFGAVDAVLFQFLESLTRFFSKFAESLTSIFSTFWSHWHELIDFFGAIDAILVTFLLRNWQFFLILGVFLGEFQNKKYIFGIQKHAVLTYQKFSQHDRVPLRSSCWTQKTLSLKILGYYRRCDSCKRC